MGPLAVCSVYVCFFSGGGGGSPVYIWLADGRGRGGGGGTSGNGACTGERTNWAA